ncbi:MAG: HEPN domain-containing protein [Candidatus Aenigmarchaeota archaeon]|nr:HEPN domain-containing protein [Candidatus Aenigmarchaeota archaeon]MCK5234477.1 HEPN domain-containing protein [Candidatus Aenigmarchaeota archaeon]MCK5373197.1 HEPN domain-containing protein [Candidatus Aenigmarchaeota archaeon]
MKSLIFLSRLKKSHKIRYTEPSLEISQAYSIKSANSLKSAKVLLRECLYENSITEAYYAIYNAVLSLFFRCGIKSENHAAASMLLEYLFDQVQLKDDLENAKKERIDKQYYITDKSGTVAVSKAASQMIRDAERFILKLRVFAGRLSESQIKQVKKRFDNL